MWDIVFMELFVLINTIVWELLMDHSVSYVIFVSVSSKYIFFTKRSIIV